MLDISFDAYSNPIIDQGNLIHSVIGTQPMPGHLKWVSNFHYSSFEQPLPKHLDTF